MHCIIGQKSSVHIITRLKNWDVHAPPSSFLSSPPISLPLPLIGGFNQRQGEALPPQIFFTLKFVVWAKLHNYRNCWHLMSDFKAKKAPNSISVGAPLQNPLGELAALPRPLTDPIPALGPPGLETTCLPKYVSLNPPMLPLSPSLDPPFSLPSFLSFPFFFFLWDSTPRGSGEPGLQTVVVHSEVKLGLWWVVTAVLKRVTDDELQLYVTR